MRFALIMMLDWTIIVAPHNPKTVLAKGNVYETVPRQNSLGWFSEGVGIASSWFRMPQQMRQHGHSDGMIYIWIIGFCWLKGPRCQTVCSNKTVSYHYVVCPSTDGSVEKNHNQPRVRQRREKVLRASDSRVKGRGSERSHFYAVVVRRSDGVEKFNESSIALHVING